MPGSLVYSMNMSADGYIADRHGDFNWSVPDDEQFAVHIQEVGELGGHLLGRRLYETMLVWDTDPSLRDSAATEEFADLWCALPKVVFSRSLTSVEGNARLATGSLAEELAALRETTDKDIGIGGATLAVDAFGQGLVDELRMFRHPVVVGGGTAFLPPVTSPLQLEFVSSRAFGSGVVHEAYRVMHPLPGANSV